MAVSRSQERKAGREWLEPSPALESLWLCFLRIASPRRRRGGCLLAGRQATVSKFAALASLPWAGGGGWGARRVRGVGWGVSFPGLLLTTEPQRIQIPHQLQGLTLLSWNWRSHLGRSVKNTELPKVNRGNNHNRETFSLQCFLYNYRPGPPELWLESPPTLSVAPMALFEQPWLTRQRLQSSGLSPELPLQRARRAQASMEYFSRMEFGITNKNTL